MASTYDIVIRGGTIMDGNGGTPFTGDVAVHNGKIEAVGAVTGTVTPRRSRGDDAPGAASAVRVVVQVTV